jgi:hypothetical protein
VGVAVDSWMGKQVESSWYSWVGSDTSCCRGGSGSVATSTLSDTAQQRIVPGWIGAGRSALQVGLEGSGVHVCRVRVHATEEPVPAVSVCQCPSKQSVS